VPRSGLGRGGVGEAVEQLAGLSKLRAQHLPGHLQQLKHPRIFHAVVDARASSATLQETKATHRPEVLRRAAGIEIQLGLQLPNGALAIAQEFEDAHPRGMPEHLEEVRFEPVDRLTLHGDWTGGRTLARHPQSVPPLASYLKMF
jgi:hypothetical protein